MRVEFRISPAGSGWQVQRGVSGALRFETFDGALRAAENLARGVAAMGETGVVKMVGHDLAAVKTFTPDLPPARSGVRYDPEQDETARRNA